ncbi:phosphate regulon sensor histidine kinase PhoR [Ottowia caeni]|uniref:phosphate regulon sensor histidine kinase PhoR n=1 Tax=Ottowia caeni TaxID=2870339 RepID=UPI001E3EF7C8|nr:phosphate regulon sensor histidine kinase PhoR [Ottowia caeni]
MTFRITLFIIAQLLGGLLGWYLGGWYGALAGMVLGSGVVFVVDSLRAQRFLRWVMEPDTSAPPLLRGLWGEAAYRTRRALRAEQRKVADSERALGEFLKAIQASPNGVVLLDSEGRIEWCNETAAQHFGFEPQRDMLQHIGNLVRQPAFAAYYVGKNYERDVTLIGSEDSASHPVKLSVQLHPYGDGQKLLLSRDITALAQAEAMRRDFVANVSHEIRTPLTVLAGFVETMQSLQLTEAERENYLSLMAAQASRMQMLVNDLLTLSQLEGSPLPSNSETVDPRELLDQCQTEATCLSLLLHPQNEHPQILNFGPAPKFLLHGSVGELRSAASNLINNAIRYTPGGGTIDVQWTQLPDGRARLAITDTGPGIAPEHLPRLAERFYRVDRSRSRESGGTGLGLAIAKHVVQRHGGELQITSQPGKGSCFALVFPAQRVFFKAVG